MKNLMVLFLLMSSFSYSKEMLLFSREGGNGGFKEASEFLKIGRKLEIKYKNIFDIGKILDGHKIGSIRYKPLKILPGVDIECGKQSGVGFTACSEKKVISETEVQYLTTLDRKDWSQYTCKEQYKLVLHELFTLLDIEETGRQEISDQEIDHLSPGEIVCEKDPSLLKTGDRIIFNYDVEYYGGAGLYAGASLLVKSAGPLITSNKFWGPFYHVRLKHFCGHSSLGREFKAIIKIKDGEQLQVFRHAKSDEDFNKGKGQRFCF